MSPQPREPQMTTLHQWQMPSKSEKSNNAESSDPSDRSDQENRMRIGPDRREYRRHDLEQQGITIERCDARAGRRQPFGRLVDISANGVRVRATREASVRPDQQIRVRLELPTFAGICPFVDTTGGQPSPKREWIGWMTVSRVYPLGPD